MAPEPPAAGPDVPGFVAGVVASVVVVEGTAAWTPLPGPGVVVAVEAPATGDGAPTPTAVRPAT